MPIEKLLVNLLNFHWKRTNFDTIPSVTFRTNDIVLIQALFLLLILIPEQKLLHPDIKRILHEKFKICNLTRNLLLWKPPKIFRLLSGKKWNSRAKHWKFLFGPVRLDGSFHLTRSLLPELLEIIKPNDSHGRSSYKTTFPK